MRTLASSLLFVLNTAALATAQSNTISTYAGGGPVNAPALSINVNVGGMAATADGVLYFTSSNAVYKVSEGMAILIAGTPGGSGYDSGDGGPATSAILHPSGVAVDGSGNLYIADTDNSRIRKVSAETGAITTVADTEHSGYNGDGRLATSSNLNHPLGVAVDRSGNVYIADFDN